MTSLKQVTHERDCLSDAIAKLARSCGIANDDAPIDGPNLLVLCDDMERLFGKEHRPITRAELIDCIREATESVEVVVPDTDYYARRGDYTTTHMDAINAYKLIEAIEGLV